LFILSFNSSAVTLHAPVVTNLTWPTSLSTETVYSAQLINVDDNIANQPLTKQDGLRLGYVDTVEKPYRGVLPANSKEQYSFLPLAKDGELLKDYMERMYNEGYMSGRFVLSWNNVAAVDKCQGFILSNGTGIKTATDSSVQGAWSAVSGGAILNIQTICSETPPQAASCNLETASITFDFGNVIRSKSADAVTSEDIYLHCIDATKIALIEPNNGKVPLSNVGLVELTENNHILDGKSSIHNVPSEGNEVIHLTAALKEPGSSGLFNGNSIITLAYP
jgi:hypothetical protein